MRFISNLIHAVVYDIAVTTSQNTSCFPPYCGQTCMSRVLPWCTYMCRVTGWGRHTGDRRTATSWTDVMTHDILLNIRNIHWLKGFLGNRVWSIPSTKSATMKLLFFMHLVCFIQLFCQTGASHVTPTVSFVEYALVIKAHGLLSCFFPPSIHLPILLFIKRLINTIVLIDHALGYQSTSCWPVLVYI